MTRKFASGYSEATLEKYPILKEVLSDSKKVVESRNSIEQEKPNFNSDKNFGNINVRRTSKIKISVPENILVIILELLPKVFTRKFIKKLIMGYVYSEGSYARTETITEELLKDSTFLEKLHGKAFLQHHPRIITFIACKLFEKTLYKTFPQLIIFTKALLFIFDIFTKSNKELPSDFGGEILVMNLKYKNKEFQTKLFIPKYEIIRYSTHSIKGIRTQPNINIVTKQPDRKKYRQAVISNFIQCLDSQLLAEVL